MFEYTNIVPFDTLRGKTFTKIEVINDEELHFINEDEHYALYHFQDCCEYVRIEDIVGDLNDLIGTPILMADEQSDDDRLNYESRTWTFYKLATIKGYVDIRFLGSSNGYYSEGVDLVRVLDD